MKLSSLEACEKPTSAKQISFGSLAFRGPNPFLGVGDESMFAWRSLRICGKFY
jgi:hypothetical protein